MERLGAVNITRQFDHHTLQPVDIAATIEWIELLDRLGGGGTFWLTVLDEAGRPHTRPVLAVIVDGDVLIAPYGAPTAGPPPYEVFRIDPATVHAIGTDAPFIGRSTRWTFDQMDLQRRPDPTPTESLTFTRSPPSVRDRRHHGHGDPA